MKNDDWTFPRCSRSLPPLDAALRELGVFLRPAERADIPLLERLFIDDRDDFVGLSPAEREALLSMQFRWQHQAYTSGFPDGDFLVVGHVDGKATIGRLTLDRGPRDWHIVEIRLSPAWRGRTIGGAILRWASDAARGAGAERLTLHVEWANDAARRFYERLGFVAEIVNEPTSHIAMRLDL